MPHCKLLVPLQEIVLTSLTPLNSALLFVSFSFFFDDTATTEIYTLSLHDALPISGADASSAGMVDAGFENQKELTKMQLDNQKEIAEMQNETQKEIAGIQSATSRQNTKDQVYAQNEMLAYQQKE